MAQQFGIGTSSTCGKSNDNCFINAGGSRLSNFTTTWTLAGPLRGIGSDGIGNFSFQVNGYVPNGYIPSYLQWVIVCEPNGPGLLSCFLHIMYFQQNDGILVNENAGATVNAITDAEMTAGTTISITVGMNSTGNVVASSGTIKTGTGQTVFSASIAIGNYGPATSSTEGSGNAQAPVVGFEAQLIGDGGADTTTFTAASGTISYSSVTPLISSSTPVGLAYVQYNGQTQGIPNGTVEKSDISYGAVSASGKTPLCVDLSTIKCTFLPPSFGLDVGASSFAYSASKISWASGDGSNITLGLPSLLLGVGPSAIITTHCSPTFSVAFSHNSTTYIWTLTAASAVLCLTASLTPVMHVYVKNVTGAYNEKEIIVTGTTVRTGTAVLLQNQVSFSLASVTAKSVCDTGCTDQQFGATSFDWSALPGASYNNKTSVLSVNSATTLLATSSFVFDPLALDGQGHCTESGSGTCNASLTTSSSPDVIYVSEHADGNDCTTPTATGLTFTLRVNSHAGDGDCANGYYAIASSTFSGNIACNWSSTISEGCNVFGVSGANTVSPFDSNGAIPCSANGNSGPTTVPACTISTSNANDFLIVGASDGNAHVWTPSGSFTAVGLSPCGTSPSKIRWCTAYEIVSSTQSSVSVGFTIDSPDHFWDAYADAIVKASASGPTIIQSTVCNGTGSKGNCAFGSNTAAGDTALVLAFNTAATSVSSINDSQSLGYALIVQENVALAGDAEGWMACQTLTAAADTVSVKYGISVTWAIILYELSPTDCAPSSSTGNANTGASFTVGSYTPINPSLVIGGVNCATTVSCGISAGASYTLDAFTNYLGPAQEAASEHITNLGTGETTPFSASAGTSSWNEISMAFQTSSTMVAITKTVSATLSISPSVQAANVHKVADTVTITPKVALADIKMIGASVLATASVMAANVKNVIASVTITPVVTCLKNLASCTSSIVSSAVQNDDYLIIIPLIMVISYLGRRKE